MTDENKVEIVNEETMLERGKFIANGYTFTIKPLYLGEEEEYLSEVQISPIPISEDNRNQPTDKELGQWAIALFGNKVNEVNPHKKLNKLQRFFVKLFHGNDYHYYKDKPIIQPFIKWIERKVSYKGKPIKFYDLERKFGLNKTEIEKLFIYFHEISGF